MSADTIAILVGVTAVGGSAFGVVNGVFMLLAKGVQRRYEARRNNWRIENVSKLHDKAVKGMLNRPEEYEHIHRKDVFGRVWTTLARAPETSAIDAYCMACKDFGLEPGNVRYPSQQGV